MTTDAPGLFDGIRILEIGQFVAAPISAQLFAHGNADVIKLEPVTGDLTRVIDPLVSPEGELTEGRQYVVKAFGKRAIPIDLSTEAGQHSMAPSLTMSPTSVTTRQASCWRLA